MDKDLTIKQLASVSAILMMAFVVVLTAFGVTMYGWHLDQKYVVKNCSDFDSYEQAEKVYKDGDKSLDKGGTKGVPCENLLRKYKK